MPRIEIIGVKNRKLEGQKTNILQVPEQKFNTGQFYAAKTQKRCEMKNKTLGEAAMIKFSQKQFLFTITKLSVNGEKA